MKNKAFTLIELLVVVLIIGILAAIALPQYKKAVEKARAVEARTNLAALINAERIYKMSNGNATNKLDELDIQLSGSYNTKTKELTSDYFVYHVKPTEAGEGFEAIAIRLDNNRDDLKYYIYFWGGGSSYVCVAKNEQSRWICQLLSDKGTTPDIRDNGYAYYYLH